MNVNYERNIKACPKAGKFLAGLKLEEGLAKDGFGRTGLLERGPKGEWALSYLAGGRAMRLTSAVDPQGEDAAMVKKFLAAGGAERGVLVLGFGLGWHLEILARELPADAPIWVLESRPELLAAAFMARDFTELLTRPGFRLFVGPFKKHFRPAGESPSFRVLWRPASLRLFSAEYPDVEGHSDPVPFSGLRLLFFKSGYYLNREILEAAAQLGLTVETWEFTPEANLNREKLDELLKLAKRFRPQLALCVNHLGFDEGGLLADLFGRLHIPVASWFVDSPFFVFDENSKHQSPGLSIFSWDSDYINPLRDMGFKHVHHLPLGSSETFFSPPLVAAEPVYPVSFVGDSLTRATNKYLARLGLDRRALDVVDPLSEFFLMGPELLPDPASLESAAHNLKLNFNPAVRRDLGALVTWRASRLYRLKILRALGLDELTVAGDENWAGLLDSPRLRVLPGLDYYDGLARFYQKSAVNINITSAQMKTGLNQRVFDVPAAGAFLLGDWRPQLELVFEPGREAVTYREPAEALDLARYYAKRPAARRKIVVAARRRIVGQHLYRFRLAELLRLLRQDHGL